MRQSSLIKSERGPFLAEQLRPGDCYELSHGHPVVAEPAGGDGSAAAACGAEILNSDPAVERAGIDTGFALRPDTLRAPDVAVGSIPDAPGWVAGKPALAIEYAGIAQDEASLKQKIADLLAAGTQQIWVVRLIGERLVEVHRPDRPVERRKPGEYLTAEGVLKNPILVEALYTPELAHEHALRNLLQRRGYDDLETVLERGELQGLRTSLRQVLEARGFVVGPDREKVIDSCANAATLTRWIRQAATATVIDDAFTG